jgi:hypothetical protein
LINYDGFKQRILHVTSLKQNIVGSDSSSLDLKFKSAKSFCKHSRVIFTPCRVVLKDERRTSNVQR